MAWARACRREGQVEALVCFNFGSLASYWPRPWSDCGVPSSLILPSPNLLITRSVVLYLRIVDLWTFHGLSSWPMLGAIFSTHDPIICALHPWHVQSRSNMQRRPSDRRVQGCMSGRTLVSTSLHRRPKTSFLQCHLSVLKIMNSLCWLLGSLCWGRCTAASDFHLSFGAISESTNRLPVSAQRVEGRTARNSSGVPIVTVWSRVACESSSSQCGPPRCLRWSMPTSIAGNTLQLEHLGLAACSPGCAAGTDTNAAAGASSASRPVATVSSGSEEAGSDALCATMGWNGGGKSCNKSGSSDGGKGWSSDGGKGCNNSSE